MLSIFIYFATFGLKMPLLVTVFALFGFSFLLQAKPKEVFWIGFFIGILWFYWIGLSFRYYHLSFMIPLVILFVGMVYGLLFFVGYALVHRFLPLFWHLFAKGALLWSMSFIHPLGFNWFVPELTLVDSYLFFDKLSFAIFLIAIVLFLFFRGPKRFLALSLLLLLFHHPSPQELAPLKIKLVTTHVAQDRKWNPLYKEKIFAQNYKAIQKAIDQKFDVVVLPESAFPTFLNRDFTNLEKLLALSHHIAIVTGALSIKETKIYNSTYVFQNGKYTILNKVVLVPFGEEIPLPKPLAKIVNHIFFDDAEDYDHAKSPQTYTLYRSLFTNAICYEATHPLIYQTPSPYIIAISNNAWFVPSIEPWLQNLLISYYAKIYHKVVYHATNMAKTSIIR